MLVKDWIEELSKFDPNEPMVLGYWQKDFLQELVDSESDYQLTDNDVLWLAERDYDWSPINLQIGNFIDGLVDEAKENTEEDTELWDTETEKA